LEWRIILAAFGLKAAHMPFPRLPDAHSSAPADFSMLSGVLIKTLGIYV
jgi:formate hydrogenlyase subunit 3/multisubunit Na+/H+ antiporter MnhD subunit